ncbi:hypothetical protein VOLCADRAFT_93817 [Volvox carteri f. nagariensis]|uniref:Nuclear cap-binding protein subunit 3 n=1 Tax=Volvox carteri f. nagariensis TaxID=3068 RepID=D8U351_VOLCA|nr:uncharacterized protein VOLCADRAFT_93817 [Volvox carteri f. nagariensis]EFJ46016.1 hypothetical protein VOLCADRAFT_93817 [Volvox carteri f. nagariensis]|eukprot:XP_002953094.1 hypothetical protein VOLCADRAFT_93817 [Volvox carteri f. nagariensis]
MAEEIELAGSGQGGGEQHAPIVFSLQQDQQDRSQSILDEEREKHRRRAERFGTSYVDPGRVRKDFGLMMEARRERLRASHGFTTGNLDVFSPDRISCRDADAGCRCRMQMQRRSINANNPDGTSALARGGRRSDAIGDLTVGQAEEREKRAARAARFGMEAPSATPLDAYKPDGEVEARARRAAKFGVPYQPADAVLMDMDLYEQRREVGKDVERRPNAIYLYGVDVMSTKEVLSYFEEYGPVFVEWLDDSSCNVLFDDSNSAKRAMVGKGTPLPPEVMTAAAAAAAVQEQEQGELQQQLEDVGAPAPVPVLRYQPELPVPDNLSDVANLPYIWHKGQDFVKDGTSVSLVFRMATTEDVRDMSQPKRTRELWKSAGGGGGGGGGGDRAGRGRGRGQQQQQRRGKRPGRPGSGANGDGDGPADMDVDDNGHGAGTNDEDDDREVPRKRSRGVRGGQRLAMREVRPVLQPYGGTGLLQVGGAVLPAKGHVLDYTELEDEDPVAAASAAVSVAKGMKAVLSGGGGGMGGGGGGAGGRAGTGGRRGGRKGRGRGRGGEEGEGVDRPEVDVRELLKARRSRLPAPAKGGPGQEGVDSGDDGLVHNGDGHDGGGGEDGVGMMGGEEGAVHVDVTEMVE